MRCAPLGKAHLHTKNLPPKRQLLSELTDFYSIATMNDSEQKPPSCEAASRRRRRRRNQEFKGLKIFPVMLRVGTKKKQFWQCDQTPSWRGTNNQDLFQPEGGRDCLRYRLPAGQELWPRIVR